MLILLRVKTIKWDSQLEQGIKEENTRHHIWFGVKHNQTDHRHHACNKKNIWSKQMPLMQLTWCKSIRVDGSYPRLTALCAAVNRVIVRHLWQLIHSSVSVMEAQRCSSVNVDFLADGTFLQVLSLSSCVIITYCRSAGLTEKTWNVSFNSL